MNQVLILPHLLVKLSLLHQVRIDCGISLLGLKFLNHVLIPVHLLTMDLLVLRHHFFILSGTKLLTLKFLNQFLTPIHRFVTPLVKPFHHLRINCGTKLLTLKFRNHLRSFSHLIDILFLNFVHHFPIVSPHPAMVVLIALQAVCIFSHANPNDARTNGRNLKPDFFGFSSSIFCTGGTIIDLN